MKIKFEACPNPNALQGYTRVVIGPHFSSQGDTPRWIRLLEQIDGVEKVMCTARYSFSIFKAELFSWEEIKPQIEAHLSMCFEDACSKD